MHVSLTFEGNVLMGSDTMPGQPLTEGTNISLSLNIPQIMDMERLFKALSEGGSITMRCKTPFGELALACCAINLASTGCSIVI